MRLLGVGIAALALCAATAACSGSGDTGSSGGWRVSGEHIRLIGASTPCKTPSPVLDTFESTPSPQPDCSASPGADYAQATANPSPSAPAKWQKPHTEDYGSATTQAWKPIYTTYTAPPGTGIYQPMVNATNQPMPTPFTTPTPPPPPTPSPLPTITPGPTQPPSYVLTTPTP